jgi:hypothetical protein
MLDIAKKWDDIMSLEPEPLSQISLVRLSQETYILFFFVIKKHIVTWRLQAGIAEAE